ncbi:MAG: protein kinase domain-containing protein [Thermodesulfobacteriota bacterium]
MDPKDPDVLKAGDVVARRYVMLRQLREEPCGWVWLAQDRSLGVDVGLKFVPRESPHFEAAREALRREGALAFKLRHSHILQAFHFEEGDKGIFLIQEPFEGESLLAHLNRLKRFRLPYALGLLEQVAQALAFAHLKEEVHQSLDPENVILDDHSAKLANFACRRPLAGEDRQVTHLELKAYTAPEVIQGEELTPAANVFSLGVLGFRLTAGSLPYALTFDEPFPYRLESIPVDLEEIPLPLQNILLECLAPDPRDRFEDAGVFLAVLEQRRESWSTPPRKWFGWASEGPLPASGVMESLSRTWGRLREESQNAAAGLAEKFKSLQASPEARSMYGRWLLGLAAGVLALVLLIWGGWALMQQSAPERAAKPAPAPAAPKQVAAKQAAAPEMGGPPRGAGEAPAPGPHRTVLSVPKPSQSAAPKTAQASKPDTSPQGRYQLLVVTYLTYDEAREMKKKIRSKGLPAMVYRVKVKNKPYFVVKAGPFPDRERAEEVARRLKKEEHLGQVPKIVKIKAATLKTSSRQARQ